MEHDLVNDLAENMAQNLEISHTDDLAEDLAISHADDKHRGYSLFNTCKQHSRLPGWTNLSASLQACDCLPVPSETELFSSSTNSIKPLSTYNNELDKNSGWAGRSDKIPIMSDLFTSASTDIISLSHSEIVNDPQDIKQLYNNHQNSSLIDQSVCSAKKPLPRISVAQLISNSVNSSNYSNHKDSCGDLSNDTGNDRLLYSATSASQSQKPNGETVEADGHKVVGELMTSVNSDKRTKDRMTQLRLEDKVDMLSLGSGSSMPSLYSSSWSEETSGECNMSLVPYTQNPGDLMKNLASQPGQNVNVFMKNVENFGKPTEINEGLYVRTQNELSTVDTFDVTSTRVWKEVKDLLEDNNKSIFLIGGSRRLKKLIGLKFLRHCQARLDCSVLSLTSSDEFSKCCDDTRKKAVLIEDAFGVNKLKEDRFDKLCDVIKKINSYSDIKAIVFTMTELCYYSCKDRLRLIIPSSWLEECVVVMETKDTALLTDIKSKFLFSVSQIVKNNIEILPEDLKTICNRTNPVFVECCENFKTYRRYDTNVMRFFKYPIDFLNCEITSLREEWDEGYITLIIVALIGEFNPNAEDLNPIAREYLKLVHKNMNFEKVCIIAKKLQESYLIKKDSNFIFRHQMYQYAVLCTIGVEFPKFLIENCPQTFLTDIILMDFDQPEFYRDIYFGKPELKCLIVNHLITEILNGEFVRLAIHSFWDSENLIKCFEEECIKRKIIREVLNKKDKVYKEHIVYWAAWNESDQLLKWICRTSKKHKLKMSSSIVKTMFVCCVKGKENTLKYLHERIHHINRIISRKPEGLFPKPVPEFGDETFNSDCYDNLLHTAVAHGHVNILKYYISEEVDINYTDSDGRTSLHIACRLGHSEIVQILLEKDASLSIVTNKFQETVLHEACSIHGNIYIVSMLLKKKLELVNKLNFKKQSAIHKAVASRNIDVVELLVQTKIRVAKILRNTLNTVPLLDRDDENNTLLHVACMVENNIPIICYLIENQPSLISKVNVRGNSPLHIACRSLECPDTLKSLLSNHADINVINEDGNTPLHEACVGNNKDKVVQFLLAQPKLMIIKNYENKLPCQLTNDANIIKLFKNCNSNNDTSTQ